MMQLGFNPFENTEMQRRHEEQVKEASLYSMAKKARQMVNGEKHNSHKMLRWIGKELVKAGTHLENLATHQAETGAE